MLWSYFNRCMCLQNVLTLKDLSSLGSPLTWHGIKMQPHCVFSLVNLLVCPKTSVFIVLHSVVLDVFSTLVSIKIHLKFTVLLESIVDPMLSLQVYFYFRTTYVKLEINSLISHKVLERTYNGYVSNRFFHSS